MHCYVNGVVCCFIYIFYYISTLNDFHFNTWRVVTMPGESFSRLMDPIEPGGGGSELADFCKFRFAFIDSTQYIV